MLQTRYQGRHRGQPAGGRLQRWFELEEDHPGRLLSMEGLRGLAVILVFLVHIRAPLIGLTSDHSVSHTLLNTGWRVGHTGVDLFFIISGYLIYKAILRRRTDYIQFMKRRYRRIYPTFLAVFVIYVMIAFAVPSLGVMPQVDSPALYLLWNILLLPGMFTIQPLITVAWTLSFEMFYYLLVPVLVGVLAMRSRSPRQRLLLILGMAAICLVLTPWIGVIRSRMFLFFVGMALHEVMTCAPNFRSNRRFDLIALVSGILAIAASGYLEVEPVTQGVAAEPTVTRAVLRNLVLGLGLGLLTFACFRSTSWLHSIFAWTPLRYLGNMSYSYYLIHSLTISAMSTILVKVLPGQIPGWVLAALIPLLFLGTLVTSAFLFLSVEKPLSLRRSGPVARPVTPA